MTESATHTEPILNIAAYKFVTLSELEIRRRELLYLLNSFDIRGTILISPEGINLFLAAEERPLREFIKHLTASTEFNDIDIKESYSDNQPFNRTLVRIKKEIIAFGVDGIDPQNRTSPKLEAERLRQWLDDGQDVVLLDVRNNYEIELGTFSGATAIDVDNFRDFPNAVSKLPDEIKNKPIVMFCTGGIRCEKAGPSMEQQGFKEVYQLEGGILKYFEKCGGKHYEGDCFVFDQRVAVDSNLKETDAELCFACQATVNSADQKSPQYVPGVSCPKCFVPAEEYMKQRCCIRTEMIAQATNPLPGSIPQDNYRPISVSAKCDGLPLIDLLDRAHPHVGRENWLERIESGKILFGKEAVRANRIVSVGERYLHLIPMEVEPAINADIKVIYEDEWIVAVNKPAPLPMHPSGRFNRNTLTSIMKEVFFREQLRIAHRLDANTTGVVVMSRSKAVASKIQPQFERGEVSKTYLARVHGIPVEDEFQCSAPISVKPTQSGLRVVDEAGLAATTKFKVVGEFEDGTSLLEVAPLTGRTNQIRVHLWKLGYPIVGDPSYLQGDGLGSSQTLPTDAAPMCLHAWKLRFVPFDSNEPLNLAADEPSWTGRVI